MSGAIVAQVGAAVVGGMISANGAKSAAAAAATKDSATGTSGFENQSGTSDVAATLKSLGYTDEQIKELSTSQQQQLSQQATSQTGQTQTAASGTKSDTSNQNQTSTGNQTTAEQLASNLAQNTTTSQTQGTVLNQFQAGDVSAAQALFDKTAGGLSPEQYQAIVNKAGMDLRGQVPGLTKALATASGTSTAGNSGLAIGLKEAEQNAAIKAASESVAASQAQQQIAANAAGTIAGATTGNNQTLEQWLQQQTSSSTQQQQQTTTGNQATTNNATTTGTNSQVSQDLSNQLASQTGTQTNNSNTTGTQTNDRATQGTTAQNTAQNQSTVSTGTSNYGEASATDVDSTRVPTVNSPNNVGPSIPVRPPNGGGDSFSQDASYNINPYAVPAYAEGGLISGGGSALPGRASGKGTAGANGAPGSAAAAQILMQDVNRKATAVNNAASVLSKYFATPMTDKDGKQLKNSDGSPIYPAQNMTDALKSATGIGDFFSRLGKPESAQPPQTTVTPTMPMNSMSTYNPGMGAGYTGFGGIDGIDGFAGGGLISGPGTGTSDSIPAVVDGKRPIAVSDGEYVIPEHVVKAVGVDYFDSLLRHFKNAKI